MAKHLSLLLLLLLLFLLLFPADNYQVYIFATTLLFFSIHFYCTKFDTNIIVINDFSYVLIFSHDCLDLVKHDSVVSSVPAAEALMKSVVRGFMAVMSQYLSPGST